MKKSIALFASVILLIACGPQNGQETAETKENAAAEEVAVVEEKMNYYGDSISAEGSIAASELVTIVEKDGGFEGKVSTVIHETCQKKGCWMKVDLNGDEDMRVSFKDYGFFVPTGGVEGREVIMDGKAYLDTTTVEMLRHFAEDAGKSEEEIAAINEPEYALAFEATGVIIKE